MKRKVIEKFDIKLNKDNILKTLGCNKESSIYNTVSGYFCELESEFYSLNINLGTGRLGGVNSMIRFLKNL